MEKRLVQLAMETVIQGLFPLDRHPRSVENRNTVGGLTILSCTFLLKSVYLKFNNKNIPLCQTLINEAGMLLNVIHNTEGNHGARTVL